MITIPSTDPLGHVWQYFNDKLGLHASQDFRGVMYVPDEFSGVASSMDHVGVAVGYNAFIGRTCCMHSVITRPNMVTPGVVRSTFHYPFVVCNLEAVLALVDSTNEAAMRFDTRLGFKHVHTVPNGGTEGDLNVLQMLRSECRWLRPH